MNNAPLKQNQQLSEKTNIFQIPVNWTRVLFFLLLIVLLVLVVPPLFVLIQNSFYTTEIDGSLGNFTSEYYREVLNSKNVLNSFINTSIFAVGSALLALLLGATQAWIVERTNTPLKGLIYFGSILSLGVPYILYTIAWLLILGKNGPVNIWLQSIFHLDGRPFNVYTLGGMILIEGFMWAPLVFMMLSATFRSVDSSFEEAARMSGAGLLTTIYHISFKLALPAILAVILLVFIRAFEAFEIPAMVGLPGDITVLTTRIFISVKDKVPADYGTASSYSIFLMFLVVILLYWYSRILRKAERFQTITGKGYRPTRLDLGKWRYLTAGIIVVNFIFVLIVPLAMILWSALLPFYQMPSMTAVKSFTLKNFVNALTYPEYLSSIQNTIIIAVISATVVLIITALNAWYAARRKKGGWLLDQLSTIPLIFPGIVLGVAVMRTYLLVPLPIYGTMWIILIAFVIKYLPYGMRYTYNGMLQIHRELEEAAEVSGANMLTVMRKVIFPLISPAFWTGWLFVLLVAARELSMGVLLSSPQTRIVAVSLFDMWNNGQVTELAAFGIMWTFCMTFVAYFFYHLARRFNIETH